MPKILFIEDEPTLQKTLGEALRQEGYEIIPALNGEDGLRLTKTEKPDLVLLDLVLPKMNGFLVLEALKKEDTTRDIPVIILTNLEQVADIDQALALGATNYLVKANYSLKEVVEKVNSALKD